MQDTPAATAYTRDLRQIDARIRRWHKIGGAFMGASAAGALAFTSATAIGGTEFMADTLFPGENVTPAFIEIGKIAAGGLTLAFTGSAAMGVAVQRRRKYQNDRYNLTVTYCRGMITPKTGN